MIDMGTPQTLQALSNTLRLNSIPHIVVSAGRPTATVGGRERYSRLVINTDRYGSAGTVWHKFLAKFNINPTPMELSGIHAGAFRYQYANKNKSICIWTQERPDQNTVKPGNAGISVLRVDETSIVKFGKIRSALVQVSNINPTRKRMTKEELRQLSEQLHEQPKVLNISDIDSELEDHDSTLDALDSDFDNLEDFGKAYFDKRNRGLK